MTIIEKKNMKWRSLVVIGLFLLPTISSAHSGTDPARELKKKRQHLQQYQQEFAAMTTDEERVRNIKKQIATLQGSVLLLRNALTKETRETREKVVHGKIDYLLAVKTSLKELKNTLAQFEEMVEE